MYIDHNKTWDLWKNCIVNASHMSEAKSLAATIIRNKDRYTKAGQAFGIPFYVVGCIHYREASFDFRTWLANGDPIWNSDGNPIKTAHVPSGLGPVNTWEEATEASLRHEGWDHGYHWDVVNALENMEAYNGEGYRMHGINSPYVWAGTNQYTTGMYTADGIWSPSAHDQRCGVVPIMMILKSDYKIDMNEFQPNVNTANIPIA